MSVTDLPQATTAELSALYKRGKAYRGSTSVVGRARIEGCRLNPLTGEWPTRCP
jgi:hypothetical protein